MRIVPHGVNETAKEEAEKWARAHAPVGCLATGQQAFYEGFVCMWFKLNEHLEKGDENGIASNEQGN